MATTVTSTKTAEKRETSSGRGSKFPGPNGKGPKGNGNGGGRRGPRRGLSPEAYRVTMWMVIAAIVMMFAALSSAYIILSFDGERRRVTMPPMFFLSTGIIILSSFTIETAKRSLKRENESRYRGWTIATLVLGLFFLAAQVMGWRELAAQGVYFASHPHSTFFYFFTGVHGVHLLGGIAGLSYLAIRGQRKGKVGKVMPKETSAGLMSLYWHTMDALWIWLFLLLLILK
ncbi:MAG TPA: cytochrome c oxidase subunit 3 [Pyrinomonadaceae bacterium]|nr:cytochrome c oxidase subunit 3 [Pyrinomonadaceae bacterium]